MASCWVKRERQESSAQGRSLFSTASSSMFSLTLTTRNAPGSSWFVLSAGHPAEPRISERLS